MVPHNRWWRFADTLLLHAYLSRPVGIFCSATTCCYLLRCHSLLLFTVMSVGRAGTGGSLYCVTAEQCAVGTGSEVEADNSEVEAGKQTSPDQRCWVTKIGGAPFTLVPEYTHTHTGQLADQPDQSERQTKQCTLYQNGAANPGPDPVWHGWDWISRHSLEG